MKKRILSIICLMAIMVSCFAAGVYGANNIEEIKAYLNYGITIKYDGQVQSMYDANGKQVYPISYEGTTYVPIRAVSNMLDVNVDWDGANNTVLLGNSGTVKSFVNDLSPYTTDGMYKAITEKDNKSKTIAGKTYSEYIACEATWGGAGFYDLGGKYTSFTFEAYGDMDFDVKLYGDNEELLQVVHINGKDLPKKHTVDVTNVVQLKIEMTNWSYIFNATIE